MSELWLTERGFARKAERGDGWMGLEGAGLGDGGFHRNIVGRGAEPMYVARSSDGGAD